MQSAPIPTSIPTSYARALKRRSARVQLKIQLAIEIGDETVLDAETITVSQHGARIRVTSTRGRLTHGERLRVSVRRGRESRPARVVWRDKRPDAHYGIELDDPGNFWGVYFPSKDGESHFERKEVRRSVVAPAAVAQPQLARQVVVEEKPAPTPLAEIGRMPAIVAGLSAIRLPFAEKVEMVFTDDPDAGVALLQNVVEPGATLRVTFAHRITKGRVLAVGGQREAGKWPVRIRCDAAYA